MEQQMSRSDHDDDAMPRPLKRQKTIHPDWYYDHANHDEHQRSNSWRYKMYTVAWICALSIEMAAAQMMLDEEHEELPRLENDTNKYLLGRIKQHNVVIACLPYGSYGTINASSVSTHLRRSFTCVRTFLMVGIGGGAPNRVDLRLGDVVVGQRVMQHDLGKQKPNGQMQHTAVAKVISHALSTVVSALRARHQGAEHVLCVPQSTLQDNPAFSRPTEPDKLFQAGYQHVNSDSDCSACDQSKLIRRRKRGSDDPIIHYGAIASGNLVIKDSVTRDKKATELDVICFEMESAGLMDSSDCLPIRGICDYSDSHKNNTWQEYAALTAAIYAKEFLHELPLTATTHPSPPYSLGRSNAAGDIGEQSPVPDREPAGNIRQDFLYSLDFPRIDARRMSIKNAHNKTCQWILSHPDYKAWAELSKLAEHHGFLWIRGKPGAGKSTIMKFIHRKMLSKLSRNKKRAAVASFFFNARGESLEKSVLGMYRSILFELLKAFPDLQSVIDESTISSQTHDCNDILFLKEILGQAVEQLGHRSFTCFIDALDECDEQQVMDMVEHFEELAENAIDQGVSLRICFSSRHYPYIEMRLGLRLVLEDQPGHRNDLSTYIQHKLRIRDPALFEDLRSTILEKAAGVFLWVILVVDILNKENQCGRFSPKKRLKETPSGLNELFEDILRRDKKNMDELLLCVLWILYAKRPLEPAEYYHAFWIGLQLNKRDDLEIPGATASDTDKVIQNCVTTYSKGLVEISNSEQPIVQFIHESVRDFLVKDRGLVSLWPALGYDWSIEGHDTLKNCCNLYLDKISSSGAAETLLSPSSQTLDKKGEQPSRSISKTYPFLEYACQNIFYHANAAADAIPQDVFLGEFRLSNWISLYNNFERFKNRRYLTETDILYILAEKGCPELIKTRLKTDKNINVSGGRYKSPLFAALAYRNTGSIAALLDLPLHAFNMDRIVKKTQYSAERSFKKKSPLTWAASEGETNIVSQLLKNGAKIDDKDQNGDTALLAAVKNKQENMARLLIEKRAEVDAKSRDGKTVLAAAIEKGQGNIAMLLIKKGVAINEKGQYGKTVLFAAVENGQENTAMLLVEKGAEIDAKDYWGNTALSKALQRSHDDIALLLLENGADWGCTGLSYLNLLCLAVKNSCHKFVTALKATEGDIDAVRHGEDLQLAAEGGNSSKVKKLLEAVASRSIDDAERWKPLMTPAIIAASSNGHATLVEALIHAGADIHCYTSGYMTLLCVAAANGHREVVKLLIQQGVDVDYSAPDSRPAINLAAERGHEDVVQLLTQEGADFNKEGPPFGTPLREAADCGHWGVVKILTEAGAVAAATSSDLKSFLSKAVRTAPVDVVRLLIEARPDSNVQFALTDDWIWSRQGDVEVVDKLDVLIRAGANINAVGSSRNGKTALHEAAFAGRERAVKALIKRGADINARDVNGSKPFDNAIARGSHECAKLLIQKEADVNY